MPKRLSPAKTVAKKNEPDSKNRDRTTIEQLQQKLRENEILLSLNNDITSIKDRKDILHVILPKLKELFHTEDIFLCRLDTQRETLNPFLRVAAQKRAGWPEYEKILSSHLPVHDGFIDTILSSPSPISFDLHEVAKRPGRPEYIDISIATGLSESLSITLPGGEGPVGILTFWAEKKGTFQPYHENLIQRLAYLLSMVVINIGDHEAIKQREKEKEILLTVSKELNSVREKKDLLPILKKQLEQLSFYSDVTITRVDENDKTFSAFVINEDSNRITHPGYREMANAHHPFPDGVFEIALQPEKPVVFDVEKLATCPKPLPYIKFIYDNGTVDMVGVSLRDTNKAIGALFLFSARKLSFSELQLNLVQGIGNQLSTVMANILANEKIAMQLDEISRYKEQLEEEKQYLQSEANTGYTYSDIIGNSEEIQKVFQQLSQVSFASSTVLILGETGTGKELVARAIHNASPRKDKLMVKINCATLPANLVESELFGHEKGSFTGATERRVGKFELAGNGTLFLDEIGELPLDLQVKLLRAIQEREIERIGGKTTIKVNARIIAATNRNLQKEMSEGKFRQDLYYRLNVFPITLPPLRERKKDIPLLVTHFIERYSKNAGRSVQHISGKAMKELMSYNWPGNVRELEHLIERSVLMTMGTTIREVHLPSGKTSLKVKIEEEPLKTFEENERDHIIKVLNKCNGKIYGPGGAAAVLFLRVSTLNSKIKKLGIRKNKLYS